MALYVPGTLETDQKKQNQSLQLLGSEISKTWRNARSAKTANYTVLNSDSGSTLALGGSAWFTLTLGAATGYDTTFNIVVLNEDTTRAKWIAPSGSTAFYLWPGQSVLLLISGSSWEVIGRSRWKLPGSTTINVNSSVGSDSNDGLATGSGNAMATVQAAAYLIANEFDFTVTTAGASSIVTILMGANDTAGLHWGPHALNGAVSGGSITLDGGGFTISSASDDSIHLFFGAVLYIQNITINNSASHGSLTLEHGARAFIRSSVIFAGGGAGAHIKADTNSTLEIDSNLSFNGNAGLLFWCNNGGTIVFPAAVTITALANATFTWTVLAQNGGRANFTNATFSLGAFTVTGKRWEADNLGLVVSNTGAPNTFFPGNANGSTSGGGQGV